jgi:hypothetical protein
MKCIGSGKNGVEMRYFLTYKLDVGGSIPSSPTTIKTATQEFLGGCFASWGGRFLFRHLS